MCFSPDLIKLLFHLLSNSSKYLYIFYFGGSPPPANIAKKLVCQSDFYVSPIDRLLIIDKRVPVGFWIIIKLNGVFVWGLWIDKMFSSNGGFGEGDNFLLLVCHSKRQLSDSAEIKTQKNETRR
jgi:hypothetical protein